MKCEYEGCEVEGGLCWLVIHGDTGKRTCPCEHHFFTAFRKCPPLDIRVNHPCPTTRVSNREPLDITGRECPYCKAQILLVGLDESDDVLEMTAPTAVYCPYCGRGCAPLPPMERDKLLKQRDHFIKRVSEQEEMIDFVDQERDELRTKHQYAADELANEVARGSKRAAWIDSLQTERDGLHAKLGKLHERVNRTGQRREKKLAEVDTENRKLHDERDELRGEKQRAETNAMFWCEEAKALRGQLAEARAMAEAVLPDDEQAIVDFAASLAAVLKGE